MLQIHRRKDRSKGGLSECCGAAGEWSVETEQVDDTTVVTMNVAIETYPRQC